MTNNVLSSEYEVTLKEDCNKLFVVLKNCENPERDEESLKILYRLIILISYKQGSKLVVITNYTVQYLCHHPLLPIVLVEILRDNYNLKVCTYTLEILAKIILKNATTCENDRKAARRVFSEPASFKILIDSFQRVYNHFLSEKTNPLFYEIQARLLRIINCVYIRRGQNQTSLLSQSNIEFIGRHLTKYKGHKEISQSLLPLIKVICRNKKYCPLICNETFLASLASVVQITTKYPAAIAILKFLSRNPDSVQEMSRSERTFQFLLNLANNHAEKSTTKKYLMTTLYRMTKNYYGVQFISKTNFWLLLLDFFLKPERFEELKHRLAMIKAYTILNRGVPNEMIAITQIKHNLVLSKEVTGYIAEKSNHHSDDSDNEEEEDEDVECKAAIERVRTSSDENEDSEESEIESEEEDVVEDEKPDVNKVHNEDIDYMKPYFLEHYEGSKQNNKQKLKTFHNIDFFKNNGNKVLENRIKRDDLINRQAFPDAVFAASDKEDNFFIIPNINYFSAYEMARKIKIRKGLNEEHFQKRTVFDLDELIEAGGDVDVPGPEIFEYMHNKNVLKQNVSRSLRHKRNPPTLQFESRFECGNLRRAEQVGDYEYNLFLSPDLNMTNGLQWFYFQVVNMVPKENYLMNIVNFQKVNSQFNYGLQPVLFSLTDYLLNSTGWKKAGDKIIYYGNEYINKETEKQFRTLSFSINFPHGNDYCYIAYHFPYTYTRMMGSLIPFLNPASNIYSRLDKLTNTVDGFNEVPLLTVTAALSKDSPENIPLEKRPLVFLTARVHPGESNSSWIMDGILQFLLDEQDERAIKAREHYIFKIIPMLNPEGVIYGKCGLTGNDLNRCWKKPHPVLHPEIYYAKKLVQFAREQLGCPISTFVDIHGHSRKKFFFLYGCNPKQSWNDNDKALADSSDFSFNLFPKALSVNENMKMSYCRYTIERKREATCRVVMWREFGIKCSYTLECSFCSGENKKKMTTKMLRDIGISIITSLASIINTA